MESSFVNACELWLVQFVANDVWHVAPTSTKTKLWPPRSLAHTACGTVEYPLGAKQPESLSQDNVCSECWEHVTEAVGPLYGLVEALK